MRGWRQISSCLWFVSAFARLQAILQQAVEQLQLMLAGIWCQHESLKTRLRVSLVKLGQHAVHFDCFFVFVAAYGLLTFACADPKYSKSLTYIVRSRLHFPRSLLAWMWELTRSAWDA